MMDALSTTQIRYLETRSNVDFPIEINLYSGHSTFS